MKIKKLLTRIVAFSLVLASFGRLNMNTASAGQDDFIMPYYNGYVDNGASIVSQNTVIDMSGYNGSGGVGFDVGLCMVTTEYNLSVTQADTVFYLPYAGTLDDLDGLIITANGIEVTPERFYGDMPRYNAGLGVSFKTVLDGIASAKGTTLQEKDGKLYTFASSETPLEYSFKKNNTQTVYHSGYNQSSQGVNGYSYRFDSNTNEEYPYRLFVSDGELIGFSSNVSYTVTDVSYQTFVDYYVNEIVAEMGEEYRPLIYSQFNRSFEGQVKDVYDVLFNVSLYTFALLKITLSIGTVSLVVKSKVKPLVNGLYKPYIYLVRTVSPYPQPCAYSLQIVPSENLPYVIENNIGLSDDIRFASSQQITDGYYVCCSEKQTEYVAGKKSLDDNKRRKWFGIGIGAVVLAIAIDVGILMIKGKKNK